MEGFSAKRLHGLRWWVRNVRMALGSLSDPQGSLWSSMGWRNLFQGGFFTHIPAASVLLVSRQHCVSSSGTSQYGSGAAGWRVTMTVLLSLLVSSGYHHKITQTGGLDNRHLFSHCFRGYKSMLKVLASLVSDWALFLAFRWPPGPTGLVPHPYDHI